MNIAAQTIIYFERYTCSKMLTYKLKEINFCCTNCNYSKKIDEAYVNDFQNLKI